jgi:Icc-related predicted phosphoesterase
MTHDVRILHAADLHGNLTHYRELLSLAVAKQADCVVMGGDLLPGGISISSLAEVQRRFLNDHLRPLLEHFKDTNPEKTVYLMMGNDDLAINMDQLERMAGEGLLRLLHLRTYTLSDSLFIAGYGCVPPTAFMIKDWERLDAHRSMVQDRSYQAYSSGSEGINVVNTHEWFLSHNTIEEELSMLARLSNPAHTVYVSHAPPYATKLDVLFNGRHIGSRSVRMFIEQHKPPLTLHGHIHESHHMTDEIKDCLGPTVCINPGQSRQVLHAVTIDMAGNEVHRIVSYPRKETVFSR